MTQPLPDAPLTPTGTRALLESLGHKPRKQLGQNFLIDGNIVRKSLQLAHLQAGETVVEIGPGLGTLTRALLAAGAKVYAVEFDSRLAQHLRETLTDRIDLLEGDAVDFPRAGLDEIKAQAGYKVIANLPYAITSPWIDTLISGPLPDRMVLMMQKEAADRLTAQHGSKQFSAVAIFLQSAYRSDGNHRVARSCFYPIPGVDSTLLSLVKLEHPLSFRPETRKEIRKIFTQRRKQISSLVRGQPHLETWLESIAQDGIPANTRPEDIPLQAWQRLAKP